MNVPEPTKISEHTKACKHNHPPPSSDQDDLGSSVNDENLGFQQFR